VEQSRGGLVIDERLLLIPATISDNIARRIEPTTGEIRRCVALHQH